MEISNDLVQANCFKLLTNFPSIGNKFTWFTILFGWSSTYANREGSICIVLQHSGSCYYLGIWFPLNLFKTEFLTSCHPIVKFCLLKTSWHEWGCCLLLTSFAPQRKCPLSFISLNNYLGNSRCELWVSLDLYILYKLCLSWSLETISHIPIIFHTDWTSNPNFIEDGTLLDQLFIYFFSGSWIIVIIPLFKGTAHKCTAHVDMISPNCWVVLFDIQPTYIFQKPYGFMSLFGKKKITWEWWHTDTDHHHILHKHWDHKK